MSYAISENDLQSRRVVRSVGADAAERPERRRGVRERDLKSGAILRQVIVQRIVVATVSFRHGENLVERPRRAETLHLRPQRRILANVIPSFEIPIDPPYRLFAVHQFIIPQFTPTRAIIYDWGVAHRSFMSSIKIRN